MLTSLALIFLVGMLLGSIFSKLRLPSLLGMLLTGLLLGPYALNLIDDSILSISTDLRQFALVIILLRGGLSLNLDDLTRPVLILSLEVFSHRLPPLLNHGHCPWFSGIQIKSRLSSCICT